MGAEARAKELNLELPTPGRALGVYKPIVVVGSLAYLSGHGPVAPTARQFAAGSARISIVQQGTKRPGEPRVAVLATLRQECGSLDHIRRLVKTTGFVQSTAEFKEHPAVINGFSELMRDVFGPDAGVAARCALGVPSLPANWAVEIETIFELEDESLSAL